jgi:hypothetical protein
MKPENWLPALTVRRFVPSPRSGRDAARRTLGDADGNDRSDADDDSEHREPGVRRRAEAG